MEREQTCGLCGCICFPVQTRLSPLEEIHSRSWLQVKHRVVQHGGEESCEGGGGHRALGHMSQPSGSVQGGEVEVIVGGQVTRMIM